MSEDRLINHKIHIILSVVTLGLWLPLYLARYLFYKFTNSNTGNGPEQKERKREQKQAKKSVKFEKRLERAERLSEKQRSAPRNKGYKTGNSLDQMDILACTHQIRANKKVGLITKGMLGKTVWCDICNADRVVTSMPSWVR